MPVFTEQALAELAARCLTRAGASREAALPTARALVNADLQGVGSHGVARLVWYCAHLRNGRVNGQAQPKLVAHPDGRRLAACLVDACDGLAYPACALAVTEAMTRAREFGVAYAGVCASNHPGMLGLHLEPVGAAGLVGLAFSNAPASLPMPGGKRALFGTNPIAAVFPRRDADPVLIDLSLSAAARGKLMVAAREGQPIPLGWALDQDGQPTTDPVAGLAGMMLPAGGSKGAMLALMVELLCAALTGAALGFEADDFFRDSGNRARLGHGFLAIDPGVLAGEAVFGERIDALAAAMLQDDAVRLPGSRRREAEARARADGVTISEELAAQLRELAGQA